MWFNFRATSSVLFSFVRWRIVMVRGVWGWVGGGAIGSGYRARGCKGALTEVLIGL